MEYQGKDLFARAGIPVPRGLHAVSPHDVEAFMTLNPGSWVIKSQVMMGGRGKAGGIKFADSASEGATLASALIGKILSNEQNPEGEAVRSLLVEEKLAIASEAYVSIAIDRAAKKPVVIVTAQGGMDVEEVAAHDPLSNYAKLDGDIGVIANGAGLGMGTMDAIRNAGGSAANFLDIGGGAQADLVKKSYRLVTDDPKVKAIKSRAARRCAREGRCARSAARLSANGHERERWPRYFWLPPG